MDDEKKDTTFVTNEFLWAYILIGLFIVGMFLRFIWGEGGFMTDGFAYQRILTVLSAIAFGFGLGWLLYPRRLPWPSKEE